MSFVPASITEFLRQVRGTGSGLTGLLTDIPLFRSAIETLATHGSEMPTLAVNHTEAAGVGGGTTVNLTQNVTGINTVVQNTIDGASLAAMQITLPPGRYRSLGFHVVNRSAECKLRLRNITAGNNAVDGMSGFANTVGSAGTIPVLLAGEFTIAVESVFELQLYTEIGLADGAGRPADNGDPELMYLMAAAVYSDFEDIVTDLKTNLEVEPTATETN